MVCVCVLFVFCEKCHEKPSFMFTNLCLHVTLKALIIYSQWPVQKKKILNFESLNCFLLQLWCGVECVIEESKRKCCISVLHGVLN